MSVILVTGSGGLIGSESVQHFVRAGDWSLTYHVEAVLREIHDHNVELWLTAV